MRKEIKVTARFLIKLDRAAAPQHVELMSKDKDLGLKRSLNPIKAQQINPQRSLTERVSADSRPQVSRFGFAVGTGFLVGVPLGARASSLYAAMHPGGWAWRNALAMPGTSVLAAPCNRTREPFATRCIRPQRLLPLIPRALFDLH
jgi:hypothetical protein